MVVVVVMMLVLLLLLVVLIVVVVVVVVTVATPAWRVVLVEYGARQRGRFNEAVVVLEVVMVAVKVESECVQCEVN
ncbi:hypothetical protein E2C01_060418 [Portunus trituberculatus]|uniref:Uncharacterized protein n=1 Tax=Portunus trituberculatus TaxID=210409 RepID=A0A5B7H2F3_PORTR|nr:hypothetical protein [Portunus trituberculatus]